MKTKLLIQELCSDYKVTRRITKSTVHTEAERKTTTELLRRKVDYLLAMQTNFIPLLSNNTKIKVTHCEHKDFETITQCNTEEF